MPLSHQHSPMDVVRLDLGLTELRTKSWHRSKPFQRCNVKTTGLCKTLHLMSVPIWSLLYLRNYANPLFRAVGYNAILALYS